MEKIRKASHQWKSGASIVASPWPGVPWGRRRAVGDCGAKHGKMLDRLAFALTPHQFNGVSIAVAPVYDLRGACSAAPARWVQP
jgi:hypothetical protein